MHRLIQTHHSEKSDSLVVNDINKLLDYLVPLNQVRIDIILDNSGFELFCDLLLADFLVQSGIASYIVLHLKTHPYFVSDVTARDLHWSVSQVADNLAAQFPSFAWKQMLESKKWRVCGDVFWTLPWPFCDVERMHAGVPRVGHGWKQAVREKSALAIFKVSHSHIFSYLFILSLPFISLYSLILSFYPFSLSLPFILSLLYLTLYSCCCKGDLNYRKLTNDVFGECTFEEALADLAGSPVPILALRTCKSEPQAGISAAQAEMLDCKDPDWRINGKFGIVQFHL